MITVRIDRIRYTYPISRIPTPETNPPTAPTPTRHALVEYAIVFSHEHCLDTLAPLDYIYPVQCATSRLADPASINILAARTGQTINWRTPPLPPGTVPAVEVRASATLTQGRLDKDAICHLFEEHVIPRIDDFLTAYLPT